MSFYFYVLLNSLSSIMIFNWLNSFSLDLGVFTYYLFTLVSDILIIWSSVYGESFIFALAILFKLSFFPLFWWFFPLIPYLNYSLLFFILVIHKSIYCLVYLNLAKLSFISINLCCLIIILISLIYMLFTYRDLMYYLFWSSTFHTGWYVLACSIFPNVALKYWVMYLVLTLVLFSFLVYNSNLSSLYDVSQIGSVSVYFMLVLYVTLTGFPPFVLFACKFILFLIVNPLIVSSVYILLLLLCVMVLSMVILVLFLSELFIYSNFSYLVSSCLFLVSVSFVLLLMFFLLA
nr:NADH dehydrogenase subunit 2 [Schmidtea mediterranea]